MRSKLTWVPPTAAMLAFGLNFYLRGSWPIVDLGQLIGPTLVGITAGIAVFLGLRHGAGRK